MAILSRRAKWSGTVSLASPNTPYDLRTLINAVLASAGAEVPDAVRELNIQSHPGIDGAGGNSNDVLVGDSQLTTSNIGYVLQSGQSRLYRAQFQNVILTDIVVQSAGTGQKLNVDLQSF